MTDILHAININAIQSNGSYGTQSAANEQPKTVQEAIRNSSLIVNGLRISTIFELAAVKEMLPKKIQRQIIAAIRPVRKFFVYI